MRIVIRADASVEIGSGHVMRCLTLANALRDKGVETVFICREHPGHLYGLIKDNGHRLESLPPPATTIQESKLTHSAWLGASQDEDATQVTAFLKSMGHVDWLIVDHYALDHEWEGRMRVHVQHIMVIDDLADRRHDCDVLLDQNLGRKEVDYIGLVPEHCIIFAGPKYAQLRPEFSALRRYSLERRQSSQLRHLLISMGGIDKNNATGEVLKALSGCRLPEGCRISVVMGSSAPWVSQVHALAAVMPWPTAVLVDVREMAKLMSESDLAIGAAGSTSLERCCMGLPSILVLLAANQLSGASALNSSGAAMLLGDIGSIGSDLGSKLEIALTGDKLYSMQQACLSICDGEGVSRIVSAVFPGASDDWHARPVEKEDELLLLEWANDPLTRKHAFNPSPITYSTHHKWLATRLEKRDECLMFIIEAPNAVKIGQARFERNAANEWEIDYALAPQFRKKGLGKKLLRTALNEFLRFNPNSVLIGKVKLDNIPSCRVFESIGFSVDQDDSRGIATYRYPNVGIRA